MPATRGRINGCFTAHVRTPLSTSWLLTKLPSLLLAAHLSALPVPPFRADRRQPLGTTNRCTSRCCTPADVFSVLFFSCFPSSNRLAIPPVALSCRPPSDPTTSSLSATLAIPRSGESAAITARFLPLRLPPLPPSHAVLAPLGRRRRRGARHGASRRRPRAHGRQHPRGRGRLPRSHCTWSSTVAAALCCRMRPMLILSGRTRRSGCTSSSWSLSGASSSPWAWS